MSAAEKPLTKRELARLLRVFAHMIEQSEIAEEGSTVVRARRKPRVANDQAPVSEVTMARVNSALRKLGVKP